jgi:hypothetical protein
MAFSRLGLLTVITTFSLSSLFAQKDGIFSRKSVNNQYAMVGFGGGSSHYWGDLSPYSSPHNALYTTVRWNGTANYTRVLNNKLAARVSVSYIRIAGDDNKYAARFSNPSSQRIFRNLHFRNDIQEIAISGIYNLMPNYGKGPAGRAKIMPYATAGIALFGHNPKAKAPQSNFAANPSTSSGFFNNTGLDPDQWVALRPLNTGGQGIPGNPGPYSYLSASLPLGIGIKYKINKNWDIALEGNIRFTLFDYLDDVGNDPYTNPATLSSVYGDASGKFSYRADELTWSSANKNRISEFINASIAVGGSYTNPSTDALQAYPLTNERGSVRKDSYGVIQITLNYVLGKSIKCPPVR